MNVYDFDGTIYHGDSSVDFYFFMIKKKPIILKLLPEFLFSVMQYKIGAINKTKMKQIFYKQLTLIKDNEIDKFVKLFWKTHKKNIYTYYLKQKKDDDVIISASPVFLLKPICKELKVKYLLASRVSKNTGIYSGLNCYGEEKVNRFFKKFPELKKVKKPIDNFYTDSKADMPLALISKKAYKVSKDGKRSLIRNM